MKLVGVRRQLEDAARLLGDAQARSDVGADEDAYRAALASRNELFHALRALAHARDDEPPEVPPVGVPGGDLSAFADAQAAFADTLAVEDDRTMIEPLVRVKLAYGRVLGVLRERAFAQRLGNDAPK